MFFLENNFFMKIKLGILRILFIIKGGLSITSNFESLVVLISPSGPTLLHTHTLFLFVSVQNILRKCGLRAVSAHVNVHWLTNVVNMLYNFYHYLTFIWFSFSKTSLHMSFYDQIVRFMSKLSFLPVSSDSCPLFSPTSNSGNKPSVLW